MLLKMIDEEKPTHMLVAFDKGKTTFRHDTFSDYKGGREKTPPELSEQLPLIRELLDAFRIPYYEIDRYEADDIIGTVAKKAEESGFQVTIFSGDKDLLQLVTKNVAVVLTKKGISTVERYDEALVQETYGLLPEQLIDVKGLMGDSSDNIPGVPGIGEKTALKLIQQFGSVENVLASIEQISGKKMKERLQEHKETALMSKELATIVRDVPFETSFDELQFGDYDKEDVIAFFKELEFSSLLDRFADDVEGEEKELDAIAFEVVETLEERHFHSPAALIVEVIDENYHRGDIVGIAVVHEGGTFFFDTDVALRSDVFISWANDPSKKKWVFDAKKTFVALKRRGIELKGIDFDVQMASYLLDPSLASHDISDVAQRKNRGDVHKDEVVYGKGAKQRVPEREKLAEHLVRKADALYQLKPLLEEELRQNEQETLYRELEMPLSLVLAEMETTGVKVDRERLKEMGADLTLRLEQLEKTIHELAGGPFNINSPKQLGDVLFEKLGLPPIKKTKTGYSTSADVLEKLAGKHEIIDHILMYRQLGKLQSTYVEGLLKVIDEDGKIHTRFNQALTQTGRLSSTDPNLQNIPIRLEEGRKIRKAFIPSESGWKIVAADYSQIELRVLAHISGDENLIDAFKKGMDIHTKTAMDVFGVKEADVTAEMRRSAKAVNFGIVYGISDYGLSQSLGITRKEAADFIERYFKSFPKVKEYMETIVERGREQGYVETLLHRRRYLPDLTSKNFNRRSFAERTALNTPIQGTAADIIKKAMVDMAAEIEKRKLKTRMLLQVHDELIFEVPESELEEVLKLVPETMERAIALDVPLKVDIAYGDTWYDAK